MSNGSNFSHIAGGLLRSCDALEVKIESEGKHPVDLIDSSETLENFSSQAHESLRKIFLALVKSNDDYISDEEVEIYARLLSLGNPGQKNVSLEEAGSKLIDDLVRQKKASVVFDHYFPHFLRVAMTHETTATTEEMMQEWMLTIKLMSGTQSMEENKTVRELLGNVMTRIVTEYARRAVVRPELVEGSIYLEFGNAEETPQSVRDKGMEGFEIIVNPKDGSKILEKVKKYENKPDPWVDNSPTALEQIMALVGHEQVKEFAQKIVRLEKGQVKSLKERFMASASGTPVSGQLSSSGHHMVLMGNPGTGKTTVANLLGKLFKEAGVLKSGHLVSVSAKDLIAGCVGQTAIKTGEVIKKARGGVLFIDEAYKLFDGNGGAEFASESVAELILAMENQRKDLVVVFAGYPEPMERLLKSNEGIPRRIKHYVTCEDYSVADLMKIRDTLLSVEGHVMDDDAAQLFEDITRENKEAVESRYWGNGGFVRDYLQNIVQAQEDRLETSGILEKLDPDKKAHQSKIHTILSTLTADDVRKAVVPVPAFLKEGVKKNPIGFAPWPSEKKKEVQADVALPAANGSDKELTPANDRKFSRKVAAYTPKVK